MSINTGDGAPRKARPYKTGPAEKKVLDETVEG